MAAIAQNKRKRDSNEAPGGRPAPAAMTSNNDFDSSYLESGNDGLNQDDGVMDFTTLDQHSNADVTVNDTTTNEQSHQQNATSQRTGPAAATSGTTNNNSASSANNTDTAAAAMAQYHTMTVPQPTEQTFMQGADGGDGGDKGDGGAAGGEGRGGRLPPASFAEFVAGGDGEDDGDEDGSPNRDSMSGLMGRNKPSVGSEEWHKQRRDNHKEVERRRRETINEGITELARIVPGCEKNKGSILQRAVQFITQLKDNETQNIEKWTLEKLLTEQAIAELSTSCDKLKAECQRAWTECEAWKKGAQKAGVATVDVDEVAANAGSDNASAANNNGNAAGGAEDRGEAGAVEAE